VLPLNRIRQKAALIKNSFFKRFSNLSGQDGKASPDP
jgi:hypothetical protein